MQSVTRTWPGATASTVCSARTRRPGLADVQANAKGGFSADTVHTAGRKRGWTMRNRRPVASAGASRASTAVTVGNHSGQRTTSDSACQTGAAFAAMEIDDV